ncbi:Jag N-terminal domain-containing protein [Pseudoflavonifractor sp. MSJ-30]|uniref:RNA-binding cell elongation regulator Jag/EloR n=1 Tax=Pseudoflavonifractor sp. MSJ-30 TaxID=2841525 RepID=UPI001C0FB38C|nr:RNA-binding cell elongation regulator Jag/EloR [Pseudoflavonifractor sp. MSJ-30]MBU5453245.1 Jag N-terminal domain-containing protein [Pseudoflavonifractor sp. MSJ-30]
MEKTLVASGKTIDLAIESALSQLGLDRDSVSVQVLQQAKSGFLGFGAQPAKVQVTYEAPDPVPEAPKVALSSASRKAKPAAPVAKPEESRPAPARTEPVKPAEPKAEASKAEPVPEAKSEAPKAERPQRPKVPREPKPAREPREPREPKTPAAPREYAPVEPGSVEEKIEAFLKGLLEHMDSKAVPHCWKEEGNAYQVELVGDDLGYLIGRRGDTLDAIQHLCNYAVNREVEGHIRVNVDAESYRQKREESLRRYARKKAQQVLKARRRATLEPMNAYERHVIHAALQDMENITTHSTGVEPNRCVVIEYVR